MAVDFLKYFYTSDFDEKIIIKNQNREYSVFQVKNSIFNQIEHLCKLKKNICIDLEDNFEFIVCFLACIFSNKNIFIINSNKKTDVNFDFDIVNTFEKSDDQPKNIVFDTVNQDEIIINIATSGTSNNQKIIKRTLKSFILECSHLIKIFDFNKTLEFSSTTTLYHPFGLTCYLFLPLCSDNIINTEKINYPEDIKTKNQLLVTTPSFLAVMQKYGFVPEISPEIIISAGAKLKKEVFCYAKEISSCVIDFYGSTETGIIGYKKEYEDNFSLLDGIQILNEDNSIIIKSAYSINDNDKLQDDILIKDNKIEFQKRNDRVFKIQEKRVSADEIEDRILKNNYIDDVYCTKVNDKLAALCVLSDIGNKKVINSGSMYEIIKSIKSDISNEFNIIPQIWKFVDIIPKTTSGKFDKNAIDEIFNLNLSIPLVLSRNVSEYSAEFNLFFYKSCNFYKGHFENYPITPGVVQLFYADFFIKQAFKIDCHIGQLRKIKFKNIIFPNSIVKLKLKRNENTIDYEFLCNDETCSSGTMPVYNTLEDIK